MSRKEKQHKAVAVLAPDGMWLGRIVRVKSERRSITIVERSGFDHQTSAIAWATKRLEVYEARRITQAVKRARNRAEGKYPTRAERKARVAVIDGYSLQALAERAESEPDCCLAFKQRAEVLWQEIAFRALKAGDSENCAIFEANQRASRSYKWRLAKAKSGLLDTVAFTAEQVAFANAQFLLQRALGPPT